MRKIVSKIVLIGSIGVGKTSLVKQFVHSKFDKEYLSTIGVKVDKMTLETGDSIIEMLIWDLAGEIFLSNLFEKYLSGASGIIGVYDVTRPSTQQQLIDIIHKAGLHQKHNNIITLGNKIDLIEDATDIQSLESSIAHDFLTSAKTGKHVNEAFHHIANTISTSYE